MFKVERIVQILFVLLASMSGLLLGLGQRDLQLTGIAMITAIAAFILNDWMGWIRFNKWIANLAAIAVTAWTLKSFFGAGSGMQLILIAKLLVYLQAVLLFQLKTPRVCWQIMVLSLLQVVVAAAFNLEFEGGLFFFVYMLIAGVTMMMLTLYADTWQIQRKNDFTEAKIKRNQDFAHEPHHAPIAVFDQTCQSRSVLRRMSRHIGWLAVIGVGFTAVLFFAVPRSQTAWFGPKILPVSETGFTKNIDLDQDGLIALSSDTVFRVWFTDAASGNPLFPENEVYYRGMALGTLKIEDGHTTWEAPYNRVYTDDYFFVPKSRDQRQMVMQRIVLEPTRDPLVYSAAPWRGSRDTPNGIEFCRPLSALTRKQESDTIEYAPYPYTFKISIEETASGGVRMKQSWPYLREPGSVSMNQNPAEYRWLTEMDKSRYPTLVQIADGIKANANTDDHYLIAQRLEQHFLRGNNYQYTLDFRNVGRDRSIDAVEDFCANHRQGHCEFYASALVLMLRSQGIPARVVVGFRGGTANETLDNYTVQKQHAHAWVEAYIRPEDCGSSLNQRVGRRGQTIQSGSWLILDPTPASSADIVGSWGSGGDALGMARNLWRDYVLGLNPDSENDAAMQSFGGDPLAFASKMINDEWWQEQWEGSAVNDPNSPWWYLRVVIPLALIAIIVFVLGVRGIRVARKRQAGEKVPTNFIWKIIGSAISLVSPRLGRFVRGDSDNGQVVDFYQRMVRILRTQGLRRPESSTQLEFANSVSDHFDNHSNSSEIRQLMNQITDFFYRVRFGKRHLDRAQQNQIDQALRQLEEALKSSQAEKESGSGST